MNGNLYFEEHPWNRACTVIAEQELGKPVEIAIQVVCEEGASADVFARWVARCEALTGACIMGDTLQTDSVVSFVGRAGDCILRIFTVFDFPVKIGGSVFLVNRCSFFHYGFLLN